MADEKKKGMLVEDRSAVEVKKDGQDVLVRTNDRDQTIKDLKENQSSPKPIHD